MFASLYNTVLFSNFHASSSVHPGLISLFNNFSTFSNIFKTLNKMQVSMTAYHLAISPAIYLTRLHWT
jgi:hypothetical protein